MFMKKLQEKQHESLKNQDSVPGVQSTIKKICLEVKKLGTKPSILPEKQKKLVNGISQDW